MKQGILVELDALLDTRIATLASLSKEAAIQALEGEYHTRPSDEFDHLQSIVTDEEYQEAYRNRTVDVLRASLITPMNFLLSEMVKRLEKVHVYAQTRAESVEVTINVYPYQLTAEEMEDIAIAVYARTGYITPIKTISIPPQQQTIDWINREGYVTLIVYNFQEWADGVLAVLDKHPENAPGVTLLVPGLLKTVKGIPKPEEMVDGAGNQTNPFEATSMLLAEVIGIDFLPVELFSIIPPDFGDNPDVPKTDQKHLS